MIFYPAAGARGGPPTTDARLDRRAGPYPLIVFAHGLGSRGKHYEALLSSWAAAGYVVAAPRFPLTNTDASGGVGPGDFVNQPGDMSLVITAMLHASARQGGPLAGMVEPDDIGVAGHSLGGITTLGVATNGCCQDGRIKAAVVLSVRISIAFAPS